MIGPILSFIYLLSLYICEKSLINLKKMQLKKNRAIVELFFQRVTSINFFASMGIMTSLKEVYLF